MWFPLLLAAAAAYQVVALLAIVRHKRKHDPAPVSLPPVSLLKPVRGADPRFAEAVRSHALLDYPEFELLFGVADPADPAVAVIERVAREYPHAPLRWVHCPQPASNGKVGVLIGLEQAARYAVLLVSDGDISVEPDYLRRVVAPLALAGTGLVTCLYRAQSVTLPGRFEALGIATEFVPSVLVAPLFGIAEFGLGSTLCFRRGDLQRLGGFAAIADYLADDYQLGRRMARLGRRNYLSQVIVTTEISPADWSSMWGHQVRWARTIRVSQGGGYLGLPITHAGLWGLLACATGFWPAGLALLLLRWVMAATAGAWLLRSRQTMQDLWAVPLRDVFSFAVWTAGLWGRHVVWRDRRLRLLRDGRLQA